VINPSDQSGIGRRSRQIAIANDNNLGAFRQLQMPQGADTWL
jgi:hypothetical protein